MFEQTVYFNLCMFAIVPDMPLIMQCCTPTDKFVVYGFFEGFSAYGWQLFAYRQNEIYLQSAHNMSQSICSRSVWHWLMIKRSNHLKLQTFSWGGPLHSQLFPYNLSEVWEHCIKLKTKAITHWHTEKQHFVTLTDISMKITWSNESIYMHDTTQSCNFFSKADNFTQLFMLNCCHKWKFPKKKGCTKSLFEECWKQLMLPDWASIFIQPENKWTKL